MTLKIFEISPFHRELIEKAMTPFKGLDLEKLSRTKAPAFQRTTAEIGAKLYLAMPRAARDAAVHFTEHADDHIILRGFPVDTQAVKAPETFLEKRDNTIALPILFGVAAMAKFSVDEKRGVMNTIRFDFNRDGMANVEPWHGHPDFKTTMFFCHKGDKAATAYVGQAREILRTANGNLAHAIMTPYPYVVGEKPFSLMKLFGHKTVFTPALYKNPQDVADLKLPDVLATVEQLLQAQPRGAHRSALEHIREALLLNKNAIVYEPGDLAIYDEHSTIRYSPGFKISNDPGQERWLQSIAAKADHSLS